MGGDGEQITGAPPSPPPGVLPEGKGLGKVQPVDAQVQGKPGVPGNENTVLFFAANGHQFTGKPCAVGIIIVANDYGAFFR